MQNFETVLFEKEVQFKEPTQLDESTPNAPATIAPGTSVTDVAQYAPKIRLARNIVGQSIPALIGFVQPLTAPSGFVFGLKHRSDTSISDGAGDTPDDIIIVRKLIETDVREVVLDTTNEVIQDVESLFGRDFPEILDAFLARGGEVYPDNHGNMINDFFLSIALNKIVSKTNTDFVTWLGTESTLKGSVNIATYDDMSRIFGTIGELSEALYKQTKKIGRKWILVSPRIAGFLSSTVGATMNNGADIFNVGRLIPNNKMNSYVMTMGDIEVYQYDSDGTVTGGSQGTTETSGRIYMGYMGDTPNSASIYYTPYKEYFIKGGDDYNTGQSSIFYRVRDYWSTNPLDTYDKSIDNVEIENSTTNPVGTNSSQFVVHADITFGENLIN